MNSSRFTFLIPCVVVVAFVLSVVIKGERQYVPLNSIQISTSFYPLAYVAEKIGGQYVTVKNILPPGGEPHDFEPSPQAYIELSKSSLFVYNGASFEPWINKWKEGAFPRPLHTVSMIDELEKQNVQLISTGDAINPHVWLSPQILIKEAHVIRDILIKIDPVNADEYRNNSQNLEDTLSNLDQDFHKELSVCEKQDVIVSHDAFGYLAREYNFNTIAIAGISPDEEPSSKTLATLTKIALSKNIKHIFFETTVSPKLSETIAREIGGSVLVLNPLESLTQHEVQLGEDYVTVMKTNLENLRTALICN